MKTSHNIAILIPCYNEEKTIAKVINDFRHELPHATIYVYDNNSTDNTAMIAAENGAVVKYECRRGKGNVVRRMFQDIVADCYVIVDGDDTYPSDNVSQMCDLVLEEGVDLVIGDRLSTTYFHENKRPFHNFGNRITRKLINLIFNSDINDIMTGYRAFSQRFVKTIPITSKGFEIETEMTIHALDKNYIIKEIPIIYKDRPVGSFSKLNTMSDGTRVIKTIFTLFRDYKPFTFFSYTAIILLLPAVILLLPVLSEYWKTGLVPRFPTLIVACLIIMLAMLLFVCGIILDVIKNNNRQTSELMFSLHRTLSRIENKTTE